MVRVLEKTKSNSTCTHAGRTLTAALIAIKISSKLSAPRLVETFRFKFSLNFRNEEYKSHIKCLTESERYESKSSYVAKANKGELKQNSWFEVILDYSLLELDLS